MKELTRAEEQIMQVLWEIEKGVVKDIVEKFPDPKPAYNTVSTIVRILEKKGIVDHEAYGRTHIYFPLISREEYTKKFLNGFVKNYFSGSFQQLVSFFSKSNNMSLKEMEQIMQVLDKEIKIKKSGNDE